MQHPTQHHTARAQGTRTAQVLHCARFVLWVLGVVAVSLALAAQRAQVLSYSPVNGDFQSYNVFRRVLAGQAPYADFANYIGTAPLVLNLPFLLLDGSFSMSLFATSFTCNVLFSLVVLVVFWLVGQNTSLAMLASVLGSKLVAAQVLPTVLGPGLGGYFQRLFTGLYTPSNSMRIARLFWPFALVLCFVAAARLWQRRGRVLALPGAVALPLFCVVAGGLCGAGVVWSNDFGLAVAFAGGLLAVLLLARQAGLAARQRAGRLGLFFGTMALGAAVGMALASGGHPLAWLAFTRDVAGAQYYYFNGTGGRAVLPYIFTNGRLLAYTLPYVAFLLYCLWRWWRRRLNDRLVLLGFLALSVLAASYAYIVSGSGYNFTEALEGCFWLAAAALAGRGVLWLLRRRQRAVALVLAAAVCAAGGLATALAVRDGARLAAETPAGTRVPALGGVVETPRALVEAAAFTADGEVFSMYATGLEVVKGQFQPSGYDYVIHALGPAARAAYLASLEDGAWPYVQTMALGVESWLCVANWDVYRLVLGGYQRAMQTEYSWIWRRAEGPQRLDTDTQVTVAQEGDMWRVTVTAATDETFVADVAVDYTSAFTSPLGAVLSLGRRTVGLTVADPLDPQALAGAYLPAAATGWAMPITVQGGVGTALLYPGDARWMTVEVKGARVQNALPAFAPPAATA